MRKLNINESITTDPFVILSEQKRFYQDLYTSSNNRIVNNNAAKSFLDEFYKKLWPLISEPFVKCVNDILRKEKCPALKSVL